MRKLIVFYVPANFKPSPVQWIPPSERGKVIEFHGEQAKKIRLGCGPIIIGDTGTFRQHVPGGLVPIC